MKATVLLLALALTGCATCRQYPTTCSAVALVAIGSIALSAGHSRNQTTGTDTHDVTLQPVVCTNGACR